MNWKYFHHNYHEPECSWALCCVF